MEYEIVHLSKEKWKGTIIPIGYTTKKYYDVCINKADKGFTIEIEKKDFAESNRLRITELWVAEKYQKQGIGHALIEMAKEQARRERRRAIILETQSCMLMP